MLLLLLLLLLLPLLLLLLLLLVESLLLGLLLLLLALTVDQEALGASMDAGAWKGSSGAVVGLPPSSLLRCWIGHPRSCGHSMTAPNELVPQVPCPSRVLWTLMPNWFGANLSYFELPGNTNPWRSTSFTPFPQNFVPRTR